MQEIYIKITQMQPAANGRKNITAESENGIVYGWTSCNNKVFKEGWEGWISIGCSRAIFSVLRKD